jgi:ABC-type transport system involved in multi-copper enzyme maturation permease subunit
MTLRGEQIMARIWAIAVNTFRQVLRMKIALVFMLLLLILLPAMGLTASGDGTLKGRLQTFVSYGISLTAILLSILTIAVSVYTLSSDIEQKQLFTVLTKPVRRFELLIGKLLGVVIFDLFLMLVFCTVIYAVAVYLPRLTNAPMDQRSVAYTEFYTARESRLPSEPDVSEKVSRAFKKLKDMK